MNIKGNIKPLTLLLEIPALYQKNQIFSGKGVDKNLLPEEHHCR